MASITPRYNKYGEVTSYRIKVQQGYDSETGKQRNPYTITYKPQKGMTEKQARKEAERQAIKFEEECRTFGGVNSSMKLEKFIPIYLETTKNTLSPTTYDFYCRKIKSVILPALGGMKLKDIKPTHIQKFVNQLITLPKQKRSGKDNEEGETISPATVRRYLTVLQSIFNLAVKQGLLHESPAMAIRLTIPKVHAPKIEIFTKQEAAEILTCLEKEDLQFQALIQLAVFTGARRGELVALKFSDVDFEQRKLTIERSAYKVAGQPLAVKPPKDYETRTITISKSCCELLKLLQEEKLSNKEQLGTKWIDGDWIFTQWNGEMMNPQTPTKQFSKFLEKYGLKHRKFHSLRHTSATLLLYAGVNIKQVQGRLGHGDIETTNKYLHLLEEADVEAVEMLEDMLLPTEKSEVKIKVS